MAEIANNGFSGGLDQDTSKSKYNPTKYLDATNFRVLSDSGLSSFSLENIKGTLKLNGGTLLDLPEVQKISFNSISGGNIKISFTDNSFSDIGNNFNTFGKTPEDLYHFIMVGYSNGFANVNTKYKIYFNSIYLLVVPTTNLTLTVYDGLSSGFLNIIPNYIPAQNNLEVIGSTQVNDDLYLFTTNNTDTAPVNSYGQIWKLVVDEITNIATLTNIYNNKINFSTYNAIAPTATLGRYENSSVQRIYWTDFYNKLRSVNVANPQLFALDLSLLDTASSVDFDIPILQDIKNVAGNHVKVGVYQCAYRLKNTTGIVTNFSELSNPINVVVLNEIDEVSGGGFLNYVGGVEGTDTGKNITWKIDNIDPDFERIEIVIVYRKSSYDVGSYSIIIDDSLNSDNYTFTYTGNEVPTVITNSEFLALTGVFTHCKTITTKDNRLIAGNVKNEQSELDFDVRAYRFNNNSLFGIIENGITTNYNKTQYKYISERSDAINADMTSFLYKDDGVTLGGSGLNISYEFETVAIQTDITTTSNFSVGSFIGAPWRNTNPAYLGNTVDLNVISPTNTPQVDSIQTYPLPRPFLNDGFKYPNISGLYRGYGRGEIYRFGIQFYDKEKNPYFVKWIGDIQFPDFSDTNVNSFYEDGSPTGIADFRLSFTSNKVGFLAAYVQSLGIRFNIENLEKISDQIGGYSIVRVKRSETDKKVISQGYVTRLIQKTVGSTNYYQSAAGDTTNNEDLNKSLGGTSTGETHARLFFVTPNICDRSLTAPNAGMILKRKFRLVSSGNSFFNDFSMFKYYDLYTFRSENYTTANVQEVGYNGDAHDSGDGIGNRSKYPQSTSLGSAAYYIRTSSDVDDCPYGMRDIYNIEAIINTNAIFGGNTYTAKSKNEYISCNHYRPVKSTVIPIHDSFKVFAGDIYVNIYDSMRLSKNYTNSWNPSFPKQSSIFFLPVESYVNTDLRHGNYVNKNLLLDNGSFTQESYDYNSVYSAESTVKKYFPKPDPYVSNNEYNNRFHISQIKINGELQDSWAVFKTLDYRDVEGTYGGINGAEVLQDQVYFIQDRAFGKLLVNPKVALTGIEGEVIQLGTGNVLDRHEYISTEIGSRHQFSYLKSAFQLFFWDSRHNKIYGFNPSDPLNPFSDIKGLHSWLQLNIKNNVLVIDKPVFVDSVIGINGIHGTYDYINNELIYTFFEGQSINRKVVQKSYTLIYSEKLNAFTAYYDHKPKLYITNHKQLISPNPTSSTTYKDLYLHNKGDYGKFYDIFYPSTIEILVNSHPEVTKTYDNLILQTEVQDGNTLIDTSYNTPFLQESFNSLEVKTDYQSSGIIPLTITNLVRRFRTWRTDIPRSNQQAANMSPGFFARFKDKYIKVKLSFMNNSNKRLIVHDILTSFRINKPS